MFTADGVASRVRLAGVVDLLSRHEAERLAPYVQEVEVRQGRTLIEKGESIDNVWFPRSCVISTVVTMPEGRTIEVGLMGFEGVAGLSLVFGSQKSSTSAIVQIAGTAGCMSAKDFIEHVVRPRGEAFDALLRYSDVYLSMIAQTAACNGLHTIEQRLARLILMTQDRARRDDLPLTQEFIAYLFGVRRASVSLAAATLQQEGLIRYSRGRMIVTDRTRLLGEACPCYEILRRAGESLNVTRAA